MHETREREHDKEKLFTATETHMWLFPGWKRATCNRNVHLFLACAYYRGGFIFGVYTVILYIISPPGKAIFVFLGVPGVDPRSPFTQESVRLSRRSLRLGVK